MSLSDLELLVLKCRTEESKVYISEAIKCYTSGAYRACIAMTWVAVVYDIINKISELSLGGEPQAIQIKNAFDIIQSQITKGDADSIKRSLEFEKEILSKATQLQLIGAHELSDLNRIKEDRNKSVHPSFNSEGAIFSASPELCRLHILNAINHLLSNPPVQGKSALEQLKKLILMEEFPHRPTDFDNAKKFLKESALKHATPALVKDFFNWLFFSFLTEGDPLYKKFKALFGMRATAEFYPTFYLDHLVTLSNKYFLEKVPSNSIYLAIKILNEFPGVEEKLVDPIKIRFGNYIAKCPQQGLRFTIASAYLSKTFKPDAIKRIKQLNVAELREIADMANIAPEIKKLCIDEWCRSETWDDSNSKYSNFIEDIVRYFSPEEIRRIVKSDADIKGSYVFKDFLLRVLAYNRVEKDTLEALLTENDAIHLMPTQSDIDGYIPF